MFLSVFLVYKMDIEKEIKIRATVRNILLSFVDIGVIFLRSAKGGSFYRKPVADYWQWREKDRTNFSKNLYYLKKNKLIKAFIRGKEEYIELTPKGEERAIYHFLKKTKIKRKKIWDGKWRVVIFDICEDKKTKRETIREWLKSIGLVELQKSIYVYPFDFKRELDLMVGLLVVSDVKYMVCDIIEGEEKLIDYFFEEEILFEKDIKKVKIKNN
ncbi:hypothetical protein KJ713_03695 [Patescibacteria group bacterium]|nr:hypothetical protein [Patescibacteria group bacterium]